MVYNTAVAYLASSFEIPRNNFDLKKVPLDWTFFKQITLCINIQCAFYSKKLISWNLNNFLNF